MINPLDHNFRRDRFGQHWVCNVTGVVFDQDDVERIVRRRQAVAQAIALRDAPMPTRDAQKQARRELFEEIRKEAA